MKTNLLYAIFGSLYFSSFLAKSITITWSTPANTVKPATGQETLKAISTHLQALHPAQIIPRLLNLQRSLQIKLCPPQPFDPLVKEFTVPRISGYTALYDHDCIQKHQAVGVNWGSKPKQPETPPSPPDLIHGSKGLSVPAFIYELCKSNQDTTDTLWLLDSDSLNAWLSSPILNYLAKPSSRFNLISPAQLMKQINTMYGVLGEKDLKNMPQAIQGALLIVLPDYTSWRSSQPIKTLFNPTWWSTRFVPRSKPQLLAILKTVIDTVRQADQLVIIHHEPTPFNFELISQLAQTYGEKNLISSTRVLPKTATTFQTLQFIQKAAVLVVDKRHLLGQISLLATGFNHNVHHFQQFLPYTTSEIVFYAFLAVWLISVIATRAYFTHKHYELPLHEHVLRFTLFSYLAATPIIISTPSLWPTVLSNFVYSLFEAGYEFILYGIVMFYSAAAVITLIVLACNKYKSRKEQADEESTDSDSDDSESLHLVPK